MYINYCIHVVETYVIVIAHCSVTISTKGSVSGAAAEQWKASGGEVGSIESYNGG